MKSVTEKQSDLNVSNEAKLTQVYAKGKYSAVVDKSILYLMSTTVISKYNVIASINASKKCIIYDRDKANLFVDWSHEHFNKKGEIDQLPETQIQQYIISYLEDEIIKTIDFSETKLSGNFERLLNRFSSIDKDLILNSLRLAGIYKEGTFIVPYTQAYTKDQITWAHEQMLSFIHLNAKTLKYDCCKRLKNGKYEVIIKNGGCGTWKQIEKDSENCCCIIFKQSPLLKENDEAIKQQVLIDVEGSAYYAANKFIKLEESFNQSLENMIKSITESGGTVDLEKVYRPNIDIYAESIAKNVRAYKRLSEFDIDQKNDILLQLESNYSNAYEELQKAKDSLKELHEIIKEA